MSNPTPAGRLPWTLKLGWGTGALGVALLLNAINLLILFYLVTIVRLEPWLAGLLVMSTKVYDAVTDPLIGIWSDKAKGPGGRRRPYLFWGSFLCAGSFFLLFTVPNFAGLPLEQIGHFANAASFGAIPATADAGYQTIAAGYILLVLLLYTTGYSVYNVPFVAMSAEMTDDFHERSSIQAYRTGFVALGTLIAGTGGNLTLQAMGEEQSTYTLIAFAFAGVMFAAMMTAWASTAGARLHPRSERRLSPGDQIRAILANEHFVKLVGIKSMQLIGLFSLQSVIAFFILNAMQGQRLTLVALGLSASLSVFFWNWALIALSKRIGKRNTLLIVGVCSILLSFSFLLAQPGDPLWHYALRGVLNGIAFAGNLTIAMSMFADAIEWDARRTGMRREGVYAASYSFVEKLAGALGPGIAGFLLSAAGYDRSLDPLAAQSAEVARALEIGVVWLPTACYVIALLILLTYRLDEKALSKVEPMAPRPVAPPIDAVPVRPAE